MTTVANTVKDVSRAISDLEEAVYGSTADYQDSLERVAVNLAYVLGKNVNLRKVTRREVALILASHGYDGALLTLAYSITRRIKALADEYGRMTSQL